MSFKEFMVNINNNIHTNKNQVSFGGIKKLQNNYGFAKHKFFFLYDSDKYDAAVEIFAVERNSKDGNYEVKDKKPISVIGLDAKGNSPEVDLVAFSNDENRNTIAYRYVLTDRNNPSDKKYAFDPGVVIGGNIVSNYADNYPDSDINRTDNKYNLIFTKSPIINKSGPMQLIMPDEYFPGVEMKDGKTTVNQALRNTALSTVRTHINKFGGGFLGIIHKLDDLEKEGYSRIVGMPLTKDTVSSHLYWTQNAYQLAPQLGSYEIKNGNKVPREAMKDYRLFQQELFKHGIDWVSDAALVNEGLQGIHFSNLLRHGVEDSPYKYWFKNDKEKVLGIIPQFSTDTRVKFVNSKLTIRTDESGKKQIVNNPDYDSKSPTYIQLYDARLVSKEQENDDTKIISTYDKNNSHVLEANDKKDSAVRVNPDSYDVKKHDDMVYPYYFAVDPDVLEENIKRAQKDLGSEFDITTVKSIKETLKFPNFKIDTKNKTAGFELWDGNVDIAKLNFYIGNQDQEKINNLPEEERLAEMAKMQRSVYNVQDYAITSGKYWTELTRDLQMAYCAKQFEGIEPTKSGVEKAIKTLVRENKLPKSVAEVMNGTLIENVVNGKYVFPKLNSVDVRSDVNPESKTKGNKYTVSDFILRNAMDFPLEAVPAANDVSGVLGSPIISKKANTNEEIGVSRYDIMIAGDNNVPKEYKGAYSEMNELYTSTIAPKIQYIINEAGLSGRVTEGENVSDLGKYILSEITPELTQYLFVKGLKPDAEIRIDEQGYFDYSNVKTEDINLNALGITRYGTPDSVTEAKELVKVIKKGINSISQDELNDIASVVGKRFKNSNLLSYRLADVIMDKTESGMGWRIDAAKDIASLDAVREGFDSFEDAWNSVINFWGKYRENVSSVNPHAYTAAEITDLNTFFKEGAVGRFNDESDATRKFLMETGITTIANYEYLYSLLPQMYTLNDVESGGGNDKAKHSENAELREKFDKAWSQNPGFMFQGPIDSVIKSYTFLGNHDKPRVMHFLALDMGVFHGKFGGNNKIVTDVLQKSEAQIDWASVKGPAIAMGLRINQAIDDKTLNLDEKTKTALKKSVAEIAGGRFKGKDINPEFFGVRPFEIAIANVFEQADYKKRLNMTQEQKDKVQAQLLRSILEPAFDRFYTMYKSMITLPGNITDFAGDKLGASGFETPSKNVYQQNRNPIRWEWLEDKSGNYDFIKEFYKKTNDIIAMRSRPELSALNDGVPITLPQYGNYDSKNQDDKKQFNKHFQAIMRYNDKGSVVITLYNSSGSNVSNTEKLNRAPKSTLEWEGYGRNSYIALSNVNADAKQSIKAGLKPGTRFYNAREDANNPAAYYEVTVGKNGDYKLEGRTKDGKPCDIVVEDKDFNARVLYKKD